MFITIDNIQYHAALKGTGPQKMICLHGFAENLTTWEYIRFEDYQMILVDLIGHGKSDKPYSIHPYRLPAMVRHVHMLVQHMDLQKYAMLGYSMGGRIALAYALAYSQEIDLLILESASYGECGLVNRIRRRRNDQQLARSIREKGIEWFNRYWSGLDIFASQMKLSEDVRDEIGKRRSLNAPHALANTLLGSGQGMFPCLIKKIGELAMPVLYINGEYDTKYRQMGRKFKQLNPGIVQTTIPGVGHNTHIEDPQAFSEAIKSFYVSVCKTKKDL